MSKELGASSASCIWLFYLTHMLLLYPPCASAKLQSGAMRDCYFVFRLTAWSVHGVSAFRHPEENCYIYSLLVE